ncbi:MAG: penicillin-binding protein 1A [Ectothiorhodospira sp.]
MKRFAAILRLLLTGLFVACLLGVLGVAGAYLYVAPRLPEVETLREIRLQVPLRVYTRDGALMAEYGAKRREPVAIGEVPLQLRQAFLAAEDDRFEEHPGVDFMGLTRAALNLLLTGEKTQGGSTITMQVARNFFLEREKTYERKIIEIFLALRIEQVLSKDEIMELYLNKIFLGHRAYGVGAAARIYYGVDVDGLTLPQAAMIAALPQAPSAVNPITNPQRALARRNYVLGRMHALGYISTEAFEVARAAPVTARLHRRRVEVGAEYLAEMVRREMVARYGDEAYTEGYRVHTTVDAGLQGRAEAALRRGLRAYDRRHGYRGPEARVDPAILGDVAALDRALEGYATVAGGLAPGIVTAADADSATVHVPAGVPVRLDRADVAWARPYLGSSSRGPEPRAVTDVLDAGDVVRLRRDEDEGWTLSQIPEVQGSLVALDPRDGSVRALAGGYDYFQSKFNRATEARRQPGSAFKPFVYSAALEHGFSPASVLNDAPVVLEDLSLDGDWRPRNYSGRFYGPTRLREALVHSRNLVSIRLLDRVGVETTRAFLERFGFDPSQQPSGLSLALGSGSVTPMALTRGYTVFANGGYRVDPWFIQRIEGPYGEVLHEAVPRRVCPPPCEMPRHPDAQLVALEGPALDASRPGAPEFLPAERVLPASNAYQITSMMQDVIRQGTGRRARSLDRDDLAGKTGTTNGLRDAWFSGYHPDLAVTTWVGFDDDDTLGRGETGSSAALPIWIDFMEGALKNLAERSLEPPSGMMTVRIDAETGVRASGHSRDSLFETLTPEQIKALERQERPAPPGEVTPEQIF